LELGGKGTIVLDEIAAFSPEAQGKLLRVLQERTFERLGGTDALKIDARLIALTSTELHAAVSAGQFREDLFFRLSVLRIVAPPLRDRSADIVPAAEHFLAALAPLHRKPTRQLSESAARMLPAHSWPGNFRELRNSVERAIVLSESEQLQPDDFPEQVRASAGNAAFLAGLRSLEDLEREAISRTLEATRYHIPHSAGILGISRKTLLEKRKKYGLQ